MVIITLNDKLSVPLSNQGAPTIVRRRLEDVQEVYGTILEGIRNEVEQFLKTGFIGIVGQIF